MRDLLSKLDAIISETALRDPEDLAAKRKALDDLEADPIASSDPQISAAIDQRRADLEKEAKSKGFTEEDIYQIGDSFGISVSEDFEIGTEIVDILEDGILINLDETAMEYLTQQGFTFEDIQLDEEKQKGIDGKACWKGYKRMGTKMKGGKRVDNCVKVGEGIEEGTSYGSMDPNTAQRLLSTYKEYSQGVEPYRDEEGADQLYDELKKVAQETNSIPHLRSLLNSASNSAHMDFDTNPGHFKNWFTYVGDHLQGLVDRMKETGKIEDEPDFEVEKESAIPFAGKKVGHKEGPAGQWRNKGPKKDKPAQVGDLVGGGESFNNDLDEAEYQGRNVPLGKPMKGDVKKSKVYVRGPKGNVVKVNFGDKKMRIKKSNPNRRKSFRARHNCDNPGPRWKARYWSCRAW